MGRHCVVQGCRSGRINEEYKRVTQGLRKTTLFQVPKSQIIRQLWVNALKQELKDKDRICEHHFMDSYIIKGKSYSINGKSIYIENERWHLKDNAIPFIVDDNDHNQLMQSMECSQSEPESSESTGKLKQPPDLPDNQITLLNHKKIKAQENEQQLSQEQKGLFIKSDELDITHVELEKRPHSQIECEVSQNDMSLEQIKLIFSSTLPERWCYHIQSPDLILIHLDATSLMEKFRLRVTETLSVLISVRCQREAILISCLKSLEELYRYMSLAETFTFCCGTSLQIHRYSKQCMGIITKDMESQTHLYPRCPPCRTLRKRLLKKQRYQINN